MDSILNNSNALSALQSLNMTQQALGKVQNEVSTGLSPTFSTRAVER